MTTSLKLLITSLIIALLTISVAYTTYSTLTQEISRSNEQLQLQQTNQVKNAIALMFNQVFESNQRINNTQNLNSVFEHKDFTTFVSITNNRANLPVETAVYDTASNTLFRDGITPEPGNYHDLENLILNQIKSSGDKINVASFKDFYALVASNGIREEGQLKGIIFHILPLDNQFLKHLKQLTGSDFSIEINGKRLTTLSNRKESGSGHALQWPADTKTIGDIQFWLPNEIAVGINQEILWLQLVVSIALMTGLIFLIVLLGRKQRTPFDQFKNILENSSDPAKIVQELKVFNEHREFSIPATQIASLINDLQSQARFAQNQTTQKEKELSEVRNQKSALQQELDSAVHAPKLKSEFLSRMGDEITTPMKTLTSMLHLLSEYSLQEEPRELLSIARRSSNSLINNLNNILDFSKLDANLLRLSKKDFDLNQLFEEILTEYQPHAESKGLILTTNVSPEVPETVFNDPLRVKQILKNLVGNAIRFTKDGEVGLYADLVLENSEQFVKLTVKDSGVGIPEEAQKGLFDSLDQRSKLTHSSFAGRLRLIVSKKLSELMGGEIGIKSEPNKGSRFWFTVSINKN